MRYSIEFGGDPQDVTITASGPATRLEFKLLYEDLAEDRRFHPPMRVLLDFTQLDTADLPARDAAEIGEALADLEDRYRASRLAVVVADPGTFGLTQGAEIAAGFEQIAVTVVYSREEALDWLASHGPGES